MEVKSFVCLFCFLQLWQEIRCDKPQISWFEAKYTAAWNLVLSLSPKDTQSIASEYKTDGLSYLTQCAISPSRRIPAYVPDLIHSAVKHATEETLKQSKPRGGRGGLLSLFNTCFYRIDPKLYREIIENFHKGANRSPKLFLFVYLLIFPMSVLLFSLLFPALTCEHTYFESCGTAGGLDVHELAKCGLGKQEGHSGLKEGEDQTHHQSGLRERRQVAKGKTEKKSEQILTGESTNVEKLFQIAPFLKKFVSVDSPLRGLSYTNFKILRPRIIARFIIEFATLIFPAILALAIPLGIPIVFTGLSIITSIVFIFSLRKTVKGQNILRSPWKSGASISKTRRKIRHLTHVRLSALANILLAIFAVDFLTFPRELSKSAMHGMSLMDLGTLGCVVAMGAVSNSARGRDSLRVFPASPGVCGNAVVKIKAVAVHALKLLPLFVLGSARLIVHSVLDLHTEVGEYGLHWNFFYTILSIRLVMDPILSWVVNAEKAWIGGACILLAQQAAVSFGNLEGWMGAADRSGFVNANREGIFITIGHMGIYLLGVTLGHTLMTFSNSMTKSGKKSVSAHPLKLTITYILTIFGASTLIYTCYHFGLRESRRLFTVAYAAWAIIGCAWPLLIFSLIECVLQVKAESFLLEGLNDNMLAAFVYANLVNGFLNLSAQTSIFPPWAGFLMLVSYGIMVCFPIFLLAIARMRILIF